MNTPMHIIAGPSTDARTECEAVLRSLPQWFGIEQSLLDYVEATTRLPTFTALRDGRLIGFITLRQHFPGSWEVHCIAVHAECRITGIGRALHLHAKQWLAAQGVRFLQVKTMAESCPSPEYAQTRMFYERIGYTALEVFPTLWGPRLPVLQLVKRLQP